MSKAKILVVEDEGVVAADIEGCLRKLGYSVVGAAASGVSAIRKAVETEPDLVLMDIKLKGAMDGVDAGGELHDRLGIPVVYLTAYADAEILERAKRTSPSGYVLKPFDERALRSAVEIALHKHPQEQKLVENERRLIMALRSIDEAVILTEPDCAITLMNRVAEALTGWKQADALGKPVKDIFTTIHALRGGLMSDPIARVVQDGIGIGLGDRRVLISRYGAESLIKGSAVPLRDSDGDIVGAALVFHAADRQSPGGEEACPRSFHSSRMETAGRLAGRAAEDFEKAFDAIADHGRSLLASVSTDPAARTGVEGLLSLADQGKKLAGRLTSYTQRRLPRRSLFDLNDVISKMISFIECAVGDGVEVVTLLTPEPVPVMADRGLIEHSILTIATAAREATSGGGKLALETSIEECVEEELLTTLALSPGYYAKLSLSYPDTGDPETQLPELHEILTLAGGSVQLRAEPGRLTTCDLYLPRTGPFTETAIPTPSTA